MQMTQEDFEDFMIKLFKNGQKITIDQIPNGCTINKRILDEAIKYGFSLKAGGSFSKSNENNDKSYNIMFSVYTICVFSLGIAVGVAVAKK